VYYRNTPDMSKRDEAITTGIVLELLLYLKELDHVF